MLAPLSPFSIKILNSVCPNVQDVCFNYGNLTHDFKNLKGIIEKYQSQKFSFSFLSFIFPYYERSPLVVLDDDSMILENRPGQLSRTERDRLGRIATVIGISLGLKSCFIHVEDYGSICATQKEKDMTVIKDWVRLMACTCLYY